MQWISRSLQCIVLLRISEKYLEIFLNTSLDFFGCLLVAFASLFSTARNSKLPPYTACLITLVACLFTKYSIFKNIWWYAVLWAHDNCFKPRLTFRLLILIKNTFPQLSQQIGPGPRSRSSWVVESSSRFGRDRFCVRTSITIDNFMSDQRV